MVAGTCRNAGVPAPGGRPVTGNSTVAGPGATPGGIQMFICEGEINRITAICVRPVESTISTTEISPIMVGSGGTGAALVMVDIWQPKTEASELAVTPAEGFAAFTTTG